MLTAGQLASNGFANVKNSARPMPIIATASTKRREQKNAARRASGSAPAGGRPTFEELAAQDAEADGGTQRAQTDDEADCRWPSCPVRLQCFHHSILQIENQFNIEQTLEMSVVLLAGHRSGR